MVLFKWRNPLSGLRSASFTFQYGSIQIELEIEVVGCESIFTFQYGSIQIVAENSADRERFIYIPIWFYSNSEFFLLPM